MVFSHTVAGVEVTDRASTVTGGSRWSTGRRGRSRISAPDGQSWQDSDADVHNALGARGA